MEINSMEHITLEETKATIKMAIIRNTHRGFIGCGSCDNICYEMECIVKQAEDLLPKEPYNGLEIAGYVVGRGAFLASRADSSSGSLTCVTEYALEVCAEACNYMLAEDVKVRDDAVALICKYAKKKEFDGWEDWRYDLLASIIPVINESNSAKVYKILDEFVSKREGDSWSIGYYQKRDITFRYKLKRQLEGQAAAKKMLYDNIAIAELRRIAIADLVETGDFDKAERLCLEMTDKQNSGYYRESDPEDWNNILKLIYQKSGQTDKEEELLIKMFLGYSIKAWDELKSMYQDRDIWNGRRQELLEKVRKNTYFYLMLLQDEEDWNSLMDEIELTEYGIYDYAEDLAKLFPDRVFPLYMKAIEKQCAEATDRSKYKKVCGRVRTMKKLGGVEYARQIVRGLMEKYPRRPALLGELQKLKV